MFSIKISYRQPLVFLLGVLLIFAASRPMAAQGLSGQISGATNDPSGAAIVGCPVRLTNTLTKQTRDVKTESSGSYLFIQLAPGKYSLQASCAGFRAYRQNEIEVTADERVSVPPIQMQIGDVSSTITVEAESARVQTDNSARVGLVDTTQIENTPLRGRDYLGLVKLLPGVVDLTTRDVPGTGSTVATINGGLTGQTLIALDGVANQDSGANNGAHLAPSVDAIAETKVLISNFQAESGSRAGGQINVVIKGGGRDFHGTGYYYKRNEAFNANNYFNNANSVNVGPDGKARRPVYRFDNYGYTIGGPLLIPKTSFNKNRNKLFFFWSHDLLLRKVPSAVQQSTMPTALERQGDFSQSVFGNNGAPVVIRNPETQTVIAGGVVPASLLNVAGQKLLNLLPLPNATDPTGNRQYNYLYQSIQDRPRTDKILRLDYTVGPKTLAYVRMINDYEDTKGNAAGALAASASWPQLQTSEYSIQSGGIVGNLNHVFSPTVVGEVSWGVNRAYQHVGATDPADLARNTRTGTGLTPDILPEYYPQANPLNVIPIVSFGAGSGGGVINNAAGVSFETRFPYFGTDTNQSVNASVSWIKAKHSFKFGFYYEHEARNSVRPATFMGNYNFGSTNTNPLDTGWGYSNAIMGVVQSYQESDAQLFAHSRYVNVEWYAQDSWKITRRLTLDLGVRFMHLPLLSTDGDPLALFNGALYNQSKNPPLLQPTCLTAARPCSAATGANPPRALDPVTGTLYPAALIGALSPNSGTPFQAMQIYQDRYGKAPFLGVGPRFGFAYDVFGNGKMAFRGGFGTFYNRGGGTGTTENSATCCAYVGDPPLLLTQTTFNTTIPQLLAVKTGFLTPQTVDASQYAYKLPLTYNWSLGVQRDIGLGMVLEVAYVGNTTRHRYNTININATPYGTTRLASGALNPAEVDPSTGVPFQANFLRPIAGYGDITYGYWGNSSNYNSMQTQLTRRFGKRFQFGGSWTWSKVMSYSPTPYINNSYTYSADGNDRRHNVTANFSYQVPNGSSLWKNVVTKELLDGWQVTGFASLLSGGPVNVSYSITGAPAGYTVTGSPSALLTRIQIIGNPIRPASQQTDKTISSLNPAAFGLPAQSAFGIGNAPAVFYYGPGVENFDLSMVKTFRLGKESRSFELRGEFYNALNHTNFNNPSSSATFNYATGAQTNANFGRYTSARDPRYIVLVARFRF